jgi:hypothetical protein
LPASRSSLVLIQLSPRSIELNGKDRSIFESEQRHPLPYLSSDQQTYRPRPSTLALPPLHTPLVDTFSCS